MIPYDPERPRLSNFRGFRFNFRPATHLPERPSWTCRTCADEWPCAGARQRLLRHYQSDAISIAMLMWTHLEHYAFGQGEGPLIGAFDRFIAWTR